jgi:hypothetical protein
LRKESLGAEARAHLQLENVVDTLKLLLISAQKSAIDPSDKLP